MNLQMKLNVAGNVNFDPLKLSSIDPNIRTYIDSNYCRYHPRNNLVIFREYIDSELKHCRLAILNILHQCTKNIINIDVNIIGIILCTFAILELYKLYLMQNPNWMPGSYSESFNNRNKFQSVINGKIKKNAFQKNEVWIGRTAMLFFYQLFY